MRFGEFQCARSRIAAIVGLQLGAFAVVLETTASGISSLPFSAFVTVMQPIHLAIGIVEGLVTASVVVFLHQARPEIMYTDNAVSINHGFLSVRDLILVFLVLALITGGFLSRFASKQPDGLEWSVSRVTGREELSSPDKGLSATLAGLQEKIAIKPDCSRPDTSPHSTAEKSTGSDNRPDNGLAGIVGGAVTLCLSLLAASLLKPRKNCPQEH